MSTEALETSLELMKEDLVQYIVDEPLDIIDEFSAEEVADLCLSVARRLIYRDFCVGHFIKFNKNRLNKDYIYKVVNDFGGFVSFSDDCGTGVSRTEYKPFYKDDEDGYFTGLCTLVSMINEAWYLCNN